jgi:hypothetical protein
MITYQKFEMQKILRNYRISHKNEKSLQIVC